jgi:hypothetical protein
VTAPAESSFGEYAPEHAAPSARIRVLGGRFDAILAALVLILAFVLVSTPIRNSDVWIHMAAGRHLTRDLGLFAPDPFAHTSDSSAWGSSSAGFDVVCYAVYVGAGDIGLVLLRLFAVAALAWVLLRADGPTFGWLPAIFTALALVAVAPRCQLQPLLVSLLMLAITLAFLERRSAATTERREDVPWTGYWPLYLVFFLWVNADAWFLLGPCAVACYWLGGLLSKRAKGRGRVPGLAVLAGLLVCLLNPGLVAAFRIPAELAFPFQQAALGHDPLFGSLFATPLHASYYTPALLRSPDSLAMAVLVAAGIAALVLNRAGRWAPRLLLCSGLLALGLLQARNLVFLAVALAVLIPRACREFSEAFADDALAAPLRLRQALVGRFGTMVAGFAIVALAWTGALQPGAPEARALCVETDPSLVEAARQITQWRSAGKLGEQARGFNFSPEIADYFAWFCPQEKGFFDHRLEVCAANASDFALVRQGLMGAGPAATEPAGTASAGGGDWRAVLRARGVDHLVLGDRDPMRVRRVLQTVLAAPKEWCVLLQAGRVIVLGWHDPNPAAGTTVVWQDADLNGRGLRPADAQRAPAKSAQSAAIPSWWQSLLVPLNRPSLDRDEAALCLLLYDAQQPSTVESNRRTWELGQLAGAIGQAAARDLSGAVLRLGWLEAVESAAAAPDNAPLATQFAFFLQFGYCRHCDDAPPGLLWTAIRAGRRAVAANPHDAEAFLHLGRAYGKLASSTPQRNWGRSMPLLMGLRKFQAIAALQHAVRLRPNLDRAHQLLVAIYQDAQYVDLAMRQTAELRRHVTEGGVRPGETPKQFAERCAEARDADDQLRKQVASRMETFERDKHDLTAAARARLAERLGLAGLALDLLLASDLAAFGKEGMLIELELLLSSGRGDEARAWLEPKHMNFLGEFAYHWIGARLAVDAGDYDDADAHLQQMGMHSVTLSMLDATELPLERGIAISVAANILGGLAEAGANLPHARLALATTGPRFELEQLVFSTRRDAELALLRAILALEQGDLHWAQQHLGRALALAPAPDNASAADTSIRPAALYFLRLLAPANQAESRP